MESMDTAATKILHWLEPKPFDRRYELRTEEGALVACLTYATAVGSLASAISADGTWTFKRVGFFNLRITIREPGCDENFAVFYPRLLGGGTLEFPDGAGFRWETTNFWGTRWAFVDAAGNRIVSFSPGVEKPKLPDVAKTQARVEIAPHGYPPLALALLALLGWYLLVLRQEETAAVAATTASAAVVA